MNIIIVAFGEKCADTIKFQMAYSSLGDCFIWKYLVSESYVNAGEGAMSRTYSAEVTEKKRFGSRFCFGVWP